ncbi:MAG: YbdD/YjiX family protein [Gemmatimonadota bacterium]
MRPSIARADRRTGILAALRRIIGMPDYEAYVAHLQTCHPEQPVPSERAFFEQYLSWRYGGGPTRCC